MADADRPLLGELRTELSRMADEVSQLAALRWRLAELELRESARTVRRFSIGAAVAAGLVFTSLSLVAVALSAWLLPSLCWAWIPGMALAGGGLAVGWRAWRQFRREFRGLEESIDELREDLAWLKEWSGR
ncbi:MAG: phage holin family protein [Thermoguttaceae bacterium]